MITPVIPTQPTEPIDAQIVEQGWQLTTADPQTLQRALGLESDPNYYALITSHAERCEICDDPDGLLAETEQAWMLRGYTELQAANVCNVPVWVWRKHVMAKGLHVTRNSLRNQVRSEMLHMEGDNAPTHKERIELMRDLDRADGVGNPTVIKQVLEYRNQVLNVQTNGDAVQRLPDDNPYRQMSDADLMKIAEILDGPDGE